MSENKLKSETLPHVLFPPKKPNKILMIETNQSKMIRNKDKEIL